MRVIDYRCEPVRPRWYGVVRESIDPKVSKAAIIFFTNVNDRVAELVTVAVNLVIDPMKDVLKKHAEVPEVRLGWKA
jgi:hypothetical protein